MKGLFAGVFIGVFFGALGYEIMNRANPEMVEAIRRKVANGVDSVMGTDDELGDEYDETLDDMDIDQQPSQA